jgi:hypothetical protein
MYRVPGVAADTSGIGFMLSGARRGAAERARTPASAAAAQRPHPVELSPHGENAPSFSANAWSSERTSLPQTLTSRPSSKSWWRLMVAGPGGMPSSSRSTVRARSYTRSASGTLPRAASACMSSR